MSLTFIINLFPLAICIGATYYTRTQTDRQTDRQREREMVEVYYSLPVVWEVWLVGVVSRY